MSVSKWWSGQDQLISLYISLVLYVFVTIKEEWYIAYEKEGGEILRVQVNGDQLMISGGQVRIS